jgi:hypothetical protein
LYDFFYQLSQGDLEMSPHTAEAFGSPELAIGHMKILSESLASLPPLTKDDIQRWVKYWIREGLFDN